MDDSKKSVSEKMEKLQREAYVSGKGIDIKATMQLDLIFPTIGSSRTRTIPNDYARSSLFTARSSRQPRLVLLREQLFHLHDGVTVFFTGTELRAADDEIVWLQILHYGKSVPLGESVEFSIKDLVRDVGWPKNGVYYQKARDCISRLKASEVLVQNSGAYGSSGAISLIDKYAVSNDRHGSPTNYRVVIDTNLIALFAGSTFTHHRWDEYRSLSPVARRLADYVDSHKTPFPLYLERFGKMCGTRSQSVKAWAGTVRSACRELETAGMVKQCQLHEKRIYTVR